MLWTQLKVAPQSCHTWEHGYLPYAKHLRSQLTVAIYTHGVLSRGEHYHTTELQIPNLGSEAPCSLRQGRLPQAGLVWDTENEVCGLPSPAAQGSHGNIMRSKGGTPFFSTHTAWE